MRVYSWRDCLCHKNDKLSCCPVVICAVTLLILKVLRNSTFSISCVTIEHGVIVIVGHKVSADC